VCRRRGWHSSVAVIRPSPDARRRTLPLPVDQAPSKYPGAVRWSSLHSHVVRCFSTPSLSPRFQRQSVAAADASVHCFQRCCFSLAALAGRLGRKLQLGQVVGLMASEVCASRVQPAVDVCKVQTHPV
jgi:hypothetical protein